MKFYKAKYLKNNTPTGRTYTFKSPDELLPGDKAETADGKHVQIVDEPVDMDWVETYGVDKVAVVEKYEPQVVVKNWSLYASNDNGFTAPELLHMHLQGNVYGRNGFNDGDPINTSRIVGIEDKCDHKDIITRTGSRYSVYPEDVNPDCEKQFPGYYEKLSLNETESM